MTQTILVSFTIEADTEREAEKLIDWWLIHAEDDDRLVSYNVVTEA